LEWALPFLLLLFFLSVGAGRLLSHGGFYHRVVAAMSVPQGIGGSNNRHGCLVVSGTYRLPHGRQYPDQEHGKKKIYVWTDSMREMLFEFSHENAGLETLHFHAELKQFKIRLPLALTELPMQNIFQNIKRLV
jgi:hypothetical protein